MFLFYFISYLFIFIFDLFISIYSCNYLIAALSKTYLSWSIKFDFRV